MLNNRRVSLALVLACVGATASTAACSNDHVAGNPPANSATVDDGQAPPTEGPGSATMSDVVPATGSVEGGTAVEISGSFPDAAYTLQFGDVACTDVTKISNEKVRCITGSRGLREGSVDIVATDSAGRASTKTSAFKFFCPWTYGTEGKTSCGAAPAAPHSTKKTATVVTSFGGSASASATGTGPTNLNDTTDPPPDGTSAAFIGSDGTGSERTIVVNGITPFDFSTRTPRVQIKVDNAAKAANLELRLGSSPTDYIALRFASGQAQQLATNGDWVGITLPFTSHKNVVVGTPNRAAISYLAFVVRDDATGGSVGLHVGALSAVDPSLTLPNGAISFTFDDGLATQATTAKSILTSAGFPATAYVRQSWVGKPGYVSLNDLTGLQASGWEIAAKTASKTISSVGFAATPAAQLEADIVSGRAWLMTNGFAGYNDCAYPHGLFAGETDAVGIASKYFTSCRTIFSGFSENVIPDDPMKLRTFLITSTTSVEAVTERISEAQANHDWLILVFRGIKDNSAETTDWPATSFSAVVQTVQSTHMPVRTVSQVLSAK